MYHCPALLSLDTQMPLSPGLTAPLSCLLPIEHQGKLILFWGGYAATAQRLTPKERKKYRQAAGTCKLLMNHKTSFRKTKEFFELHYLKKFTYI